MDSCWFLLLGRILAVEFLAEFDELALEGLEAVGDGVGHVGVVHRRLGDALPPSVLMIRAGTPITVEFGGTDFSTTELAPILTLSPILIPPRIFAPAPTTT